MIARSLGILLLASLTAVAQPQAPPLVAGGRSSVVDKFPSFGGVNGDQIYRSRVVLHATQLTNELNTIKTLLNGPRVPQVYKQSLNALAVTALQQGENMKGLATRNGTRQQILSLDGPLDQATQALSTQASRFTQFAPGLAESLQRLEHTDQQLHAAIHQGGGGPNPPPPPNPDFQLQRVRRLASTLENQTESLRDLGAASNDNSPAGRVLEQAARQLSFKANRFDRTADSVPNVLPLRDDFAGVLANWRAVNAAMRTFRVSREFRIQATHVESTLRAIGELIPNNTPWDYGDNFVPPPLPPGPGPGPVIPPFNPGVGFLHRGALVIGAGEGGGPRVRLFADLSGEAMYDFFAYDMNFVGGVRVATADLNGDNVPDLVVAPGPGMAPLIRVFDGRNMQLLTEFFAFDTTWTGGVFVAAADRTRSGQSWIAVSADAGTTPQVRVFDIAAGKMIDSFVAYDERFRGGVRIALGDINGDGTPDLITVPGPGGEPRVRVLDGRNRAVMGDFLAFDPAFNTGLTVDTSDLTRNGRADLIVGTDAGVPSVVRIFDAINGKRIGELQPFPPRFQGGVRVAAYDFDRDGVPDVVCSPGRDPNHLAVPIRIYSGVNSRPLGEFYPFGPQFRGGSFVGSR
ncbi:hypothetical protein BH11PLA2_BH11PLA2_21270 [soil metagenome]